MPQSPRPPGAPEETRLESDDEIRQALEARLAQRHGKGPARGRPVAAPPEPDAVAERPEQRPPMALLCILDDGKADGELVRIRADRTVLGRVEGDVRIPHDGLMSGRHAEIVRQPARDGWRWVLTDLKSTNGTWIRIGSTQLRHQNEFMVGHGHYRFEVAPAATAPTAATAPVLPEPPAGGGTLAWASSPVVATAAALVDLTPGSPGQRFALTAAEYWIGRDAHACLIARPDDTHASPRHARLHRDARGHWTIDNHRSTNGLWLRVDDIPLGANCQFRLGEQRFLFRVL
jgi:hypothetical protein